jgi:hypothetical protein
MYRKLLKKTLKLENFKNKLTTLTQPPPPPPAHIHTVHISVADPGCFIPDPTIAPSRIRGVKKHRIRPLFYKFCLLIPDPDPTIAPSRIRIPDPGGKKAPDTQHCYIYTFFLMKITFFCVFVKYRSIEYRTPEF